MKRLLLICCVLIEMSSSAIPLRYSTSDFADEDSRPVTKYYVKHSSNSEDYSPKFEGKSFSDDVKKREIFDDDLSESSHVAKPRRYYTKRSDVNAVWNSRDLSYDEESSSLDSQAKKRNKRFILEGIRLLGTAVGQAIESPSTAFSPSPALNSLTDRRPFFNDGSSSVVQIDNGLSAGGYGGDRFNDYGGGYGGGGGYRGRESQYFDDSYNGYARETFDDGYNYRNHPLAF